MFYVESVGDYSVGDPPLNYSPREDVAIAGWVYARSTLDCKRSGIEVLGEGWAVVELHFLWLRTPEPYVCVYIYIYIYTRI